MTTNTIDSNLMPAHRTGAEAGRILVPIGRLLLSMIFLNTILGHFSSAGVGYAAQQGVPMANVLVPLSGVIALAGALSIVFGFHARIGALLLALFLIPVTLLMHQFWNVPDAMQAMNERVSFLKNLSILGGVTLIGYFGAGPISFDERRERAPRSGSAGHRAPAARPI
jgi:putative oxidoreductase